MTVEDRLGRIENTVDKLVALQENVVEILRNQQALLEEMRQDNAYTRKLWVAVARKLDLFDDLPDPG